MKKRFLGLLAALCLAALALAPAACAAGYLDQIDTYDVTVTLRGDGSADLVYDIRWTVLDSSSEGPLEWAKVGVPNQNIDELTPLSDTIRRISPYDEGGSYVRLDLNRSYYEGETVRLQFSLHATHLYEVADDGSVNYEFTPGWFDAAETGALSLTWLAGTDAGKYSVSYRGTGGSEPYAAAIPGGALVTWKGLAADARVTLKADYPDQSAFSAAPLDPELGRGNAAASGSGFDAGDALLVLLFTALVIWLLCRRFSGDYWLGGFGGWFWPHHHHHHGPGPGGPGAPGGGSGGGFGGFGGGASRGAGAGRRSSGSSHSGGCVCACACVSCACACACAGGGRAGCSAKEFRGGAAIDTKAVLTALARAAEQEEKADG